MTELNQWEYRVLTVGGFFKGVKDEELEALLNQLGEEGWEVVGFRAIENTNQAQLILKRPLDRTARRWRTMP
jgi:Domain of unknown function (DUF4177)